MPMVRAMFGKTTVRWYRRRSRMRRDWNRPFEICCPKFDERMKTLASLFACTALVLAAHAALSPQGLTCEYTVDPLGIDISNPRLFWKLQSGDRGQRQSAYHILVASSTNLLAQNQGDLWDSGKVASDDSIQILYAGRQLKSSQIVFWKVRVWDRDNNVSEWSSIARWTMGLVATSNAPSSRDSGPAEWQAKWICAPAAT